MSISRDLGLTAAAASFAIMLRPEDDIPDFRGMRDIPYHGPMGARITPATILARRQKGRAQRAARKANRRSS